MNITIHRGTHQIGGCATEIRTNNTRIFIDFGAELDEGTASPLAIEGVTAGDSRCDAIFFTHYHGDHMGLMDMANPDIPLYMGKASKEILKRLNNRTRKFPVELVERIRTFEAPQTIVIGDIAVTPLFVDHSAYDAHMFLIEADGKRVLHTGDFRNHGFRGKGLLPTLRKYVGKVDALICEGTTLNRPDYSHISEQELRSQIKTVLEENKYVFVLCSSTNFDRIASVCSVIPKGKYCICDDYQYEMIQYLRQTGGTKSALYACDGILRYGRNLDERMTDKGFSMFVRSGNPFHRQMMERFPDAVVIYSMWKGYLERPDMQAFLRGFHRIDLHTSGHADGETIRTVIDTVDPGCIIPMHTEKPDAFISLADGRRILFPQDGDCITL